MSYVSQETPFFYGPVRENLVLGKEVSEEELIGVLKKVRLDSLFQELEGEWISGLGNMNRSLKI